MGYNLFLTVVDASPKPVVSKPQHSFKPKTTPSPGNSWLVTDSIWFA